MSDEQMTAVVKRLWDEIWNNRDEAARVAAVDQIFAPDLVAHRSGRLAFRGRERMTEFARVVPRIYGNVHSAIDDLIVGGDKVVVRWTLTGTHDGELLGVAPTGKLLSFTGITIHRIADGKIAEIWVEEDWLGALRQMGIDSAAKPAPGESTRQTAAEVR